MGKKDTPLISVIIPTKNASKYIKEALTCLLEQDLSFEVVVVDSSTDGTATIAKELGAVVIETPANDVEARNIGLERATGEYIMFLDGDDVVNDGAIATMLSELTNDTALQMVSCMVKDFFSPELTKDELGDVAIKAEPYYGLLTGAVMIRRGLFDTLGKFDVNFSAAGGVAWLLKAQDSGVKHKKLPIVATNRRIHTSNYGRTQRDNEFKNYANILRGRIKRG
ncbi:hypothetical protein RsTz2092_06830 [Deferribacterales bacterium RsTz2092]|nr:hypothetical protein AGMMS49941_04980 [Deferribacterales bacterium]